MIISPQSRILIAGLFLLLLLCPLSGNGRPPIVANELISIYADPPLEAFALGLEDPLTAKINALFQELGVYPDTPADFFIVSGKKAYQELTTGKGKIVEHSDAFYSPHEKRIYIRSPEQVTENYLKILLHEYIHWYIDYIFGTAPLWFHEGMAVQYAQQLGMDRYYHFIRSRFWGEKLNLNEMYFRYPATKSDWDLYYLTSAFAIKYMRDEHPEAWQKFWTMAARVLRYSELHNTGMRQGFSNVFFYAYGLSANAFSTGFDSYTRRLGYQYLFMGFNALLLGFLPFILIIAYFKRRSRMKRMPEYPEPVEQEEPDADLPGGEEEPV
ncbi:MAG: hypothetical protein U1C33_05925 [Candidatus Cloacimonadaceae bacterium]|nr:hypothetical protein [Candidatus Cloacimonadaceae bacterium]